MVEQNELANGAKIIVESMTGPSVNVAVWVEAGTRDEDAAQNGVAHFLEHAHFKGTGSRNTHDITRSIESLGGSINALTSKEYTCYYASAPRKHLDVVLDVLSDLLLSPTFPTDGIERERSVVLQEIAQVLDDPEDMTQELFASYLWPDSALGRPIAGTADTVAQLGRADLYQFRAKHYRPRCITVTVVGDTSLGEVLPRLRPAFGSWLGEEQPRRTRLGNPPYARFSTHHAYVKRGLQQTYLCIGAATVPMVSPNRYALSLLNVILGGTAYSRLVQEIREERGLAYAISSSAEYFSDTGVIIVEATTSPIWQAITADLITKEFFLLASLGVGDEELQTAKTHLQGAIEMAQEGTFDRACRLASNEMYFRQHIPMQDIMDAIEAVTAADIKRVARQYLCQPVVVTLGPDEDDGHQALQPLQPAGAWPQ